MATPALPLPPDRFFELEVLRPAASPTNSTSSNSSCSVRPFVSPTALRIDPTYSKYYVNLTRFLLCGGGPMGLLCFLYIRVRDAGKGKKEMRKELR